MPENKYNHYYGVIPFWPKEYQRHILDIIGHCIFEPNREKP